VAGQIDLIQVNAADANARQDLCARGRFASGHIDKRRNDDVSTRVDLLRLQPLLLKCR
jgi:hypothetical protein